MLKQIVIALLLAVVTVSGQSIEDCMECHADEDLTKSINDSTEVPLYVDLSVYEESVHGGFDCIDCHSTIEDVDHGETLPEVNCALCHDDVQEEYSESIHAVSLEENQIIPLQCKDCHGYHNVFSSDDQKSMTYKLNIENTCGTCHAKQEVINLIGVRGQGPVALYHNSVHDKILSEGPDNNAPTCISCHGYHQIFLMSDPRSSFNKLNRAETCGVCHEQEKEEYLQSIHWRAVKRGHFESPVCNDCHGEHFIESPTEIDAITNRLNLSSQICAKCHSSQALMARFGLDPERFSTYMRTYHGLALLKGSPEAANCTSCHEVHAILEQTSPRSSIHPDNLESTCGQCHDDITSEFISISVHPTDLEGRNPIAFYAEYIYIWIIVLTIGGMFIHNLIIVIYYTRQKRNLLNGDRTFQRFLPFEVYQHGLLILSFIMLVITGFALKFPDALWVQWLTSAGMNEELRSLLHRIAAIILILISLIQLTYFVFFRKGRREIFSLRPNISDVTGFWANMKFYLGISKNKPKFGRWDYTEKAEYLALIWGTAVMVLTGLILWFPELFMGFLPAWIFEVAEIIHYYEAWLASLAIFIWHWFFVIYHPEKYPMNLTWIDGKITEKELKHHHPLEYEALNKE
jgi:cytochrome b subunit of formate dehydrogenase/nitrate/TMAO reductase-like tetraheme cytochrome c subunit